MQSDVYQWCLFCYFPCTLFLACWQSVTLLQSVCMFLVFSLNVCPFTVFTHSFWDIFWHPFLFLTFSHALHFSILPPKYQSQMTNPFSNWMNDAIQVEQICAACCKNKYRCLLPRDLTSFIDILPLKMTATVRYLPCLGSQAAIMFLVSNICWVSSGTVRARYCWLPLAVSGANPGMKKWSLGKGTMLVASFLRSAFSWPGNLRQVVMPEMKKSPESEIIHELKCGFYIWHQFL